MKKLVFVLFGILIGVLGSHLMKQNSPNLQMNINEDVNKPIDVGKKAPKDLKRPKGIITTKRAKALSKGYDSRYKLINKSIDREDNRSVWFSIEEIESFLEYTKYEAENLLDKKYTVNGVRVYLATYPENNPDQYKAGYTTVFMVSTYDATISKSSVFPVNTVLKIADIPEGSPLNEGELGRPPSSTYPN
ncbi:hypothetical protein [uncultured Formosa sp.]|uniref:hypothetical protein n=1 Tax=uncultured Formosa sp. TaxID=255435 RepID=UPI00261CA53A|nr:hypothetical protein [uncultured Formosa sp.]